MVAFIGPPASRLAPSQGSARQRISIAQSATRRTGNSRLAIYTESLSLVFNSPFAPREVDYSGYEATYNEILRPDRKPILSRSGSSLRRVSMSLFVGSTDPQESINDQLKTLEDMADSRLPLTIEYDPRTYGQWTITSMSYTSVERRNDSDEITRANVDLEFTEVTTDTQITINEVTRVRKTRRPKSFTPKKRLSMFKIAKRFYGTKNKKIVRAIAKANGIKNLRRVPPGKSIRLP